MKKFIKRLLFVMFISTLVIIMAGAYISLSAGDHVDIKKASPLASVVVMGDVARSSASLNQWLRGKEFDFFAKNYGAENFLLAHYDNPFPTQREHDFLENLGLATATLPFISEEDLAYLLKEDPQDDPGSFLRELAVLQVEDNHKIIVLNLPLDMDRELMDQLCAEVAPEQILMVKFQQESGDWNPPLFQKQAEAVIDMGARVVMGQQKGSAPQVQIYQDAVIIAGLGSFLGGREDDGVLVSIEFYPEGIVVGIDPIAMDSGVPKFLRWPWQYFTAQNILKPFSKDFAIQSLRGSYVSPPMVKAEDFEKDHDAETETDINDNEVARVIDGYGVAAGHVLAVDAGMKILEEGGNAIDAAVAVAYALAVVEPEGSGLGGGGIMLLHLAAENRQVVIDYRETAPSNVNRGEITKIMRWPSTGIPGFVRGMERAIETYGTLEYAAAIQPALNLARDGFPMTGGLRSRISNNSGKLARSPGALQDFFKNGWPTPVGQNITQPKLAQTLENIMEEGSTVFYEGYIKDTITDVLAKQGMHIPPQDFLYYEPVIREPIKGEYRDYTIVTVPPPAGGFNILQQLNILSHFDLSSYTLSSPEVYKLMEETIKATYSDRRNYVGDPNFVLVPMDELLSPQYVAEKVQQINEGKVPLIMYTDPFRPSDNTTHFVVVDSWGNWVSVTNTLSYLFGNGLQAEGFFLNSQLKNFSSNPSSPNYFQPGKRPFSHISPTLVFQGDTPVMALGSPGGRRIPAYLTQVMVYMADFGLRVEEAVDHPRFWSEGKKLWLERGMPSTVASYFRSKGYTLDQRNPSSYFGRVAAIYYDLDTATLSGTGDTLRGDGTFKEN